VLVAAGRKVTSGPGGDAGGHHLGLRDLELGRADLLGEEARERLPRALGALATDVLGRPGLVDLAAFAMGKLVMTLGGRGRGSGERAGEGDDEESDEDAKAGNDHESEDRRFGRPPLLNERPERTSDG
jgi:hypothetical protein